MSDEQQQPIAARSEEFGEFSLPLASGSGSEGRGGLTRKIDDQIAVVAAKRKWNIPDSVFETLPQRMEELANSDSRQAVGAAKVLLDMNEQNEADEVAAGGGGDVVIFLPDNGRGLR